MAVPPWTGPVGLAHTVFLLHAWRPFLHCPFWSAWAPLRGLHPRVPGLQTPRSEPLVQEGRASLPPPPGPVRGQRLDTLSRSQPHRVRSPTLHGSKAMPLAALHPPWLAPGVSLPLVLGPGLGVPRAWIEPREVVLAGQGSWVLRATPGEKAGAWGCGRGFVGGEGWNGPRAAHWPRSLPLGRAPLPGSTLRLEGPWGCQGAQRGRS